MNRCRVCNKFIAESLTDILLDKKICSKCQSKFTVLNKIYNFEGHEMLSLYKYEGEGKKYLYNFKAQYDIGLAPIFTDFYKFYLKEKYKDYSFYCAPSSEKDDEERGFNHVVEIAKNISKKVYSPFHKKIEWKQSGKNAVSRAKIGNFLEYFEPDKNDKIVLIDDVITTGSTLRGCLQFLGHKKDVKILTIFKHK